VLDADALVAVFCIVAFFLVTAFEAEEVFCEAVTFLLPVLEAEVLLAVFCNFADESLEAESARSSTVPFVFAPTVALPVLELADCRAFAATPALTEPRLGLF